MSQVYVVRNQDGYFATKKKEWECGRDPKILFRSPHKDEAINIVFELSSKDIYLRAEAIVVDLNEDKQPIVEVTAPPKPKEDDLVTAVESEGDSDAAGDDAAEAEGVEASASASASASEIEQGPEINETAELIQTA